MWLRCSAATGFYIWRFDIRDARRLSMGDVVFMLAEQTNGLIQPYEMWPLGCSHPLCSCGTQLVKDDDGFVPVTRQITRRNTGQLSIRIVRKGRFS